MRATSSSICGSESGGRREDSRLRRRGGARGARCSARVCVLVYHSYPNSKAVDIYMTSRTAGLPASISQAGSENAGKETCSYKDSSDCVDRTDCRNRDCGAVYPSSRLRRWSLGLWR